MMTRQRRQCFSKRQARAKDACRNLYQVYLQHVNVRHRHNPTPGLFSTLLQFYLYGPNPVEGKQKFETNFLRIGPSHGNKYKGRAGSAQSQPLQKNPAQKYIYHIELGLEWFLLDKEASAKRAALLDMTGQSSPPPMYLLTGSTLVVCSPATAIAAWQG